MANFTNIQITNLGRALQAKAQAGAPLVFTRFRIGSGSMSGQQIADMTNLITPVMWLTLNKSQPSSAGRYTVGAPFSNNGITTGFYFREWGIFATDPDVGEIMYCYGNVGAGAEYIPAGGGSEIVEQQLDIITLIGNATNVSATIDQSLVFATIQQLNSHKNAAVLDHPDGSVTEAKLGTNSVTSSKLGAGAVTDVKIGNRTASDSVTPSFTGAITALFSSLFTLIKNITGKASALTAPAINLEQANTEITALKTATTDMDEKMPELILSATPPSDPTPQTWWYEDLGDDFDLGQGLQEGNSGLTVKNDGESIGRFWEYIGTKSGGSTDIHYILLAKTADVDVRIQAYILANRRSGSSSKACDQIQIYLASNGSASFSGNFNAFRASDNVKPVLSLVTITYDSVDYIALKLDPQGSSLMYEEFYFYGMRTGVSAFSVVNSVSNVNNATFASGQTILNGLSQLGFTSHSLFYERTSSDTGQPTVRSRNGEGFTLFEIEAPTADDNPTTNSREATLVLMRRKDPYSGGTEFTDIYDMSYADSKQCGIRVQSRGTGVLRDWVLDFQGSSGSRTLALRAKPNGELIGNGGLPIARFVNPPATATSTGLKGQLAEDDAYLYICTDTDTWRRVALSTW